MNVVPKTRHVTDEYCSRNTSRNWWTFFQKHVT